MGLEKLAYEEIMKDFHRCCEEYRGVYEIPFYKIPQKFVSRIRTTDFTKGWGVIDEVSLVFEGLRDHYCKCLRP